MCPPGSVEASRREYQSDMDLLAAWLGERCETGPKCGASLDQLWLDWEAWAKVRGELRYIDSRRKLARKLKSRGYQTEATHYAAMICGIKLRKTSLSEN